jgi:hypothetical protein
MQYGYGRYVAEVLELAGLTRKVSMEEYEPWDPYRVSRPARGEPGDGTPGGGGVSEDERGLSIER